jgi:cyclic pyranopterin phosphate synthase
MYLFYMLHKIDRGMVMTDIRVMEKHGGKSGSWKVE